tara:strand:+ start:1750 stop:2229 length:480 start_codon:yes stop_codon:yes gene_type:complete
MTDTESFSTIAPLALSGALILATVVIHMVGLIILMGLLQNRSHHIRPFQSVPRQGVFIVLIVLGLVVIHSIEIWLYTMVYLGLNEFTGVEEALYYSIATFTTAGYGDVVQSSRWRIVGAVESFNGFLLLGWSTAFLVSVIGRLRSMETEWLEKLRNRHD